MDISESVKKCLEQEEMSKGELAKELKTSAQTVSTLVKSKHCSPDMLAKLCDVFKMKASEFIALGE